MVSVIIVNYNTYLYTEKCIESIYNETIASAFEIILVSNGSSDRNIKEIKFRFPDITLIENESNLGFAKANNIGIGLTKGEYILLLNSDTELLNDAISSCATILTNEPSVGVVSCQLQFPDGKIQHSCQSFPFVKKEAIELLRLHKFLHKDTIADVFRGSFFSHNENCSCDWVWGTFFMFRKQDLEKLANQKLSEEFFMYGEDMEWCYQFQSAHLKIYYSVDGKVMHHMGQSDYGNNIKKTLAIFQNESRFLKKYKGYLYAYLIKILKSLTLLILSIKNKSNYPIARLYIFQK